MSFVSPSATTSIASNTFYNNACRDYSGVIINQNAPSTGTYPIPNGTSVYQTFTLPGGYVRGTTASEQRYPDFSGLQVLVNVAANQQANAQITYGLGYWSNTANPTIVASGTVVGTSFSGQTWFDLIFPQSVPITAVTAAYQWIIQLTFGSTSANQAFNSIYYASPTIVNGNCYSTYTYNKTYIGNALASLNFRLLGLVADEGTDIFGNTYRSVVLGSPVTNTSTTSGGAIQGGAGTYWMSRALPAPDAVSSLYFDIRQNNTANPIYSNINLINNPSFEHDFSNYAPAWWSANVGRATLRSFYPSPLYATQGSSSLYFSILSGLPYNTSAIVSPNIPIAGVTSGSYIGKFDYKMDATIGSGCLALEHIFFDSTGTNAIYTSGINANLCINGNFQYDTVGNIPYGWTTGTPAPTTFQVQSFQGTNQAQMVWNTNSTGSVYAQSATSAYFNVTPNKWYQVTSNVNVTGPASSYNLPTGWSVSLQIQWLNNSNAVVGTSTVASTSLTGLQTLTGCVKANSGAYKGCLTLVITISTLNGLGTNSIQVYWSKISFGTPTYIDGATTGYGWVGTAGQSTSTIIQSVNTNNTGTITQITNVPANASYLSTAIAVTPSTSSIGIYIDGICVTYSQSATPTIPAYFDGDSYGATWLGQYGNSASGLISTSISSLPTVVDSVFVRPITHNTKYNIYYSNDDSTTAPYMDTTAWEQKLWTRVPKVFTPSVEPVMLPSPIAAKYIKIEFTNPQAFSYNPGELQLQTEYRTFPSWVRNYFNAISNNEPYVTDEVIVQQNALTTMYINQIGSLQSLPQIPAGSPQAATVPTLAAGNDNTTLSQINLDTDPYASPLGAQADSSTTLGQIILNALNNTITGPHQVTEADAPSYPSITNVSSLQRDQVLIEHLMPDMYFFLTCRHQYQTQLATFNNNKAYFFGVQSVTFLRSNHTVVTDTPIYTETGADSFNTFWNDFVYNSDGSWVAP